MKDNLIIHIKNRREKGGYMFHLIQIIAALPVKILFPAKFYGKKNLPKGPCIIVSNHTSNTDSVLLIINTWEKKYFLAKKELFKNKLFGWFIKRMGAIKIDRQSSDVAAIKQSLKVLKDGKKLVIYPEGTRTNNANMQLGEVKHGASIFAIKAKVPLVPMFISRKPKLFHKTRVYLGEPFTLEEFYGRKLDNETLDASSKVIAEKLNELHDIALNSLTKKD